MTHGDMEAFLAIMRHGSITAAARHCLSPSPPCPGSSSPWNGSWAFASLSGSRAVIS